MADLGDASRLSRWRGLASLAARRVAARAGANSRQLGLTVAGVALPVALMLVVTSVGLGLATGTTVQGEGIDYWIVPESSSAESAIVSVSGPQLGRVHDTSARIGSQDGVTYATPVLVELVRAEVDGTGGYLLAIGVVPRGQPDEFAGVSTRDLTPGDPFYDNGTFNGTWTGEAVLSPAAGELLDARPGSTVAVIGTAGGPTDHNLTVANVSGGGGGTAQLPVALVHLSELQAITGADAGDQADQILVKTDRPGVKRALQAVYPRSLVLSRAGLTSRQVFDSKLPLAMSAAALVAAVVIGVLFAASTMGLAIAAESRTRALLSAIGFSGRSRAALVASEGLLVALLGGVAGVGLGLVGIVAVNELVARYVLEIEVARFHPALVAYGLAVALLIGALVVPYLLLMSRRTTTIEALRE